MITVTEIYGGEEGFFAKYQALFIDVFGEYIPHRPPDFICIITDGESIGFAECLVRKPGEVHLMYGGVPRAQSGIAANVRGYRALLEHLHRAGYKSLMTEIENTNRAYLKLAISEGFLINGARIASDGKVIVELYKTNTEAVQ